MQQCRVHAGCMLSLVTLFIVLTASQSTVQKKFVNSATNIDVQNATVELPLYGATLPNGTRVYYIVTEASTPEAAGIWQVNLAPSLNAANGTSVVQRVLGKRGNRTTMTTPVRPSDTVIVPATVNFLHGKRGITPDPSTGFPPLSFNYSAQGHPGYSPLLLLPDGSILNAPHVAVELSNGSLALHPKVVAVAANRSSMVFQLTQGFADGQPILYISTEASNPLAATLENVPYVPLLSNTTTAALIDIVAFTNGQTGKDNPQRQGLASAIQDGLSPLNVVANTPNSPSYSPLWALNMAKWVVEPGDRQTSVSEIKALSSSGRVASFNPQNPNATPPLAPSGIVVNCPVIATVTDPTAAAAAADRGSSCAPSSLGYSCVIQPQQGVSIHYTLGNSIVPANPCTKRLNPTDDGHSLPQMTVSLAGSAGSQNGQQQQVHFAVEAVTPGFVAMSFPEKQGEMFPADAVIGFDGSNAETSNVRAYHIVRYGVEPSDAEDGWAMNLGFVSQGGKKIVCFSRALDAPAAAVVKSINPNAALPINWAISDQNALQQHSSKGSLSVGLASGATSLTADSGADANAYRIAHGALMLTAWVLLMPTAVVMARHKWMFGNKKTGDISAGWFRLHQGLNITAVLLALAAVGLIFGRFKWTGRADTVTYYIGHRAVGMAAIVMMIIQGLLGALRPHLGSDHRAFWRRSHQFWGWLTLVTGTTAAYMGIALIRDLSAIPITYWLAPAVAVSGALLVAGLALEIHKHQLEINGQYDKAKHRLDSPLTLKTTTTNPARTATA